MKPLSDVIVIDATIALAGPYATMLLAGLGAQVIKIEDPKAGDASRNNSPYIGREGLSLGRRHEDDLSLAALSRLRSKLGVTINLKSEEGRGVFLELCRKADVVVQNFSRGVMERLGVGYEDVHAVNPRLVYCSISGFGNEGTPGGGKAMDSLIQGLSGAMLASGLPNDPPIRVGYPVADLGAPLFGVIGILSALHHAPKDRRWSACGCVHARRLDRHGSNRTMECDGGMRRTDKDGRRDAKARAFWKLQDTGWLCGDLRSS